MTRLLGRIHSSFCPACKAKPGPDCPDSHKPAKAVRQEERRQWSREAEQGAGDRVQEDLEHLLDELSGAHDDPAPDFTVPLHEVTDGVFTTYCGRCKCGCGCSTTEDCHCIIAWEHGTLYARPAPEFRSTGAGG